MPASANGSTASATPISTTPIFAIAGCFVSMSACMTLRTLGLSTIRDSLAEQAGGAEYEYRDQHEEREDVLVVAAEERQVRIAHTTIRDRGRPARQLAQVRQIADVTGAE